MKGDSLFADLIGWIHANLDAPLDVAALAAKASLSERTFHRKFVAATDETPARFVEMVRLDAARMLLSRGLSLKSVAARELVSAPLHVYRRRSNADSESRRGCSAKCMPSSKRRA